MEVSVEVVVAVGRARLKRRSPAAKARERSERKKGEVEEKGTKREEVSGPIGRAGYRTQWVRSSRRVRGGAANR